MFSPAIRLSVMDQEVGGTDLTENDLIQSALTGDLEAFNHLVIMHQSSLYWWVFSLVNDEAQADDITQTTFIAAYEKLYSFRTGSFKAWLFTIARNRSYDELRRKKRSPLVSLDDADDDFDHLELLPDSTPLPEEALLASEQSERIEQMLSSLPDVFQQVVRLIDIEGLDYVAAADLLDLPLGTVKSRLNRARMKMRSLFKQCRLL
jgi:RNA polymerase sigma-70 factor, ECF subfamily